jgi:protein-S-isoprenylcysteine O-methyltransferase Ste14
MQPLPSADHRASVAFGVTVGLFGVMQLATGVVTDVRKHRSAASHVRLDRSSLPFVIVCCGLGVAGAFLCAYHLPAADITPGAPVVRWALFGLGIVAIAVGTALRLWAIFTMGRWFTYDVRVTDGQVVVDRGPYRWVRHPSYTGILLVLSGIGLTLTNWLSLLFAVALPVVGLVRRIRVEEAALATLGPRYDHYAAGRPRLVPGVW